MYFVYFVPPKIIIQNFEVWTTATGTSTLLKCTEACSFLPNFVQDLKVLKDSFSGTLWIHKIHLCLDMFYMTSIFITVKRNQERLEKYLEIYLLKRTPRVSRLQYFHPFTYFGLRNTFFSVEKLFHGFEALLSH